MINYETIKADIRKRKARKHRVIPGLQLSPEDEYLKKISLRLTKGGYLVLRHKKKDYMLSRIILEAPRGTHVDHINGNKLDHRRENLRITDAGTNARNRKKKSKNRTGYMGVLQRKSGNFEAYINVGHKRFVIGTFRFRTEAAIAYDLVNGYITGPQCFRNLPAHPKRRKVWRHLVKTRKGAIKRILAHRNEYLVRREEFNSFYIGVTPNGNKFEVRIRLDGQGQQSLGNYASEFTAAMVYDLASRVRGRVNKFNFPGMTEAQLRAALKGQISPLGFGRILALARARQQTRRNLRQGRSEPLVLA